MFDVNKLKSFKINPFGLLENINLFSFPIATRLAARLISSDLVAVQPMSAPVSTEFLSTALFENARYDDTIHVNEPNKVFNVKPLKKFRVSDTSTSQLIDTVNELIMMSFIYEH